MCGFARRAPELLPKRNYAKQTIGVVIRARCKEELVDRSVVTGGTTDLSMPELKGPNIVYLDWVATGVTKRPEELTRLWIKCVNPASGDVVANENRIAHWTEVRGSLGNAPR
jgi:hypothetical protein